MKFRTTLALFLAAAVALVALAGCNAAKVPPQSYVQAHRATHTQAKHVFDKFEAQNPGPEAQAAKNLYDSEGVLITNAEKGVYPAATPAPVGQ